MTNDKRPREWWIKKRKGTTGHTYWETEVSSDPCCKDEWDDFKTAIHVIEYDAYAALKADADKLAAALDKAIVYAKVDKQMFDAVETLHGLKESEVHQARIEVLGAALAEWRAKWG